MRTSYMDSAIAIRYETGNQSRAKGGGLSDESNDTDVSA